MDANNFAVNCVPQFYRQCTYLFSTHGLVSQGVDIERDEQSVEKMVRKNVIEALNVEREDVRDIVEMVQVLGYKLF